MLKDVLSDLTIEVAIRHFQEKTDEKKLKNELQEYLKRNAKYQEMACLDEELDYEGLIEYVSKDLINEVETRVFDPHKKNRGKARTEIETKAIHYSNAKTDAAKRKASKCILDCIDIIHEFYKKKQPLNELVHGVEIVNAIEENTIASITDAKEFLEEKMETTEDRIIESINNSNRIVSIDKAIELIGARDYQSIEENIQSLINHASIEHPLHPDFGFDYEKGTLISKPLNEKAAFQYPDKLLLTGLVKFNNKPYTDRNGNPVSYAYRHQLPMTIEVASAVKYLGDTIDPVQNRAEKLVGSSICVTPPKFPPALPCSILVKDEVYIDYVLLRTQEVLDTGMCIIDNSEQQDDFFFSIRLDPDNPDDTTIQMQMNSSDHKSLLKYYRLRNKLVEGETIHIYSLTNKKDFISGCFKNNLSAEEILSNKIELDLLERACIVEEHFDVRFDLDQVISQDEYKAITYLSDLIRKKEITGTWKESLLKVRANQEFREELANMKDTRCAFLYVVDVDISILGEHFCFKVLKCLKDAYINEYEKVLKRANCLSDGEEMEIMLKSGDDNQYVETMDIPTELRKQC